MEATKQLIVEYVDRVGGRCLYAEMIDAIPAQNHRNVPGALRQLKHDGELYKQNRVVDGSLRFEVFRPDNKA